MPDRKKDTFQIRNSTVDFLVFTRDAHEDGIEVRVQDQDVWLTQKAIAQLFEVDRSVVTKHLKNVYESGELSEAATCANFAQVADNGKTYHYKFYALSAIIAVGYRVNSGRATEFRQWATKVLSTFTRQGYVLDKDRLINGQIFDEDYFDHLISEIQEIRASERRFYQKITDIYSQCSADYDVNSPITKEFFATVQNKLHYAAHGHTAAEVIYERADADKPFMGLTTFSGDFPTAKDIGIAKNYLTEEELRVLNQMVSGYFDFAEVQAIRHRPMYMSDYVEQLDNILRATGEEVLTHAGKISHAQAMEKAKAEYKRYQAQTLSPVEEEYLKTIKQLGKTAKTEAEKQDDSSDPS